MKLEVLECFVTAVDKTECKKIDMVMNASLSVSGLKIVIVLVNNRRSRTQEVLAELQCQISSPA